MNCYLQKLEVTGEQLITRRLMNYVFKYLMDMIKVIGANNTSEVCCIRQIKMYSASFSSCEFPYLFLVLFLLTGLQSNSGLWNNVVRLSVRLPDINILLTIAYVCSRWL